MLYIRHRINTASELAGVPVEMGIELDLRYRGNDLILQHDPYKDGERFDEFLNGYRHALMIMNVKSEGIEQKTLELVKSREIKDYFFLDLSFPMIMKLSRTGIRDIAVRYSEHEPLEQCLALKGLVKWVWVDCFTRCPLDDKSFSELKRHFRMCLVSPELQKHPLERIAEFKKQLAAYDIDAVCTKKPELWRD